MRAIFREHSRNLADYMQAKRVIMSNFAKLINT